MIERVGLVDVDSKKPNLALMRRSAYHRSQGRDVERAIPLAAHTYDLIERSKMFDFSPDDLTPWPCEVVSGGPGYDVTATFGPDHDTIYPDYSLYGCECAVGRFTRGCIRRCPWCMVWRQDGSVRPVAELRHFWRGQERLWLLDDNLAAIPDLFVSACEELARERIAVKFDALDVRLLDDSMCRALLRVRRWGNLHFSWDSMHEEQRVIDGLLRLKRHYPSMHDVLVYVLIGFDTDHAEDLYRVERLRDLGIAPFAMPFNKADPYQRAFARWVNRKQLFKSCSFSEFYRTEDS